MSSPSAIVFHQPCPVCGRTLQIRVQLLGRRVYCQHCGGGFVAQDESLGRTPSARSRIEAADELLERASALLQVASVESGD